MDVKTILRSTWEALSTAIHGWWDEDLHTALEPDVRRDPAGTLLYLPHPYLTPGGSASAFPEMYGWDTYFINCGLLAHGRTELVKNHILNQLYMISRYGKVLNGNRSYYLTRSQTPLLAESLARYSEQIDDPELLTLAYSLLEEEFCSYWGDAPHTTPTGLATAHDSGDPHHRPELAAEAETGLDFCPIFGGDVRRCAPLILNCALVRYALRLAQLAGRLGLRSAQRRWQADAESRSARLRDLCWDVSAGFFLEYDFVAGKRLPYRSLCAYLTLWAGVATPAQAGQIVRSLPRFEGAYGLAFTDTPYSSPHPEFAQLQWQHPVGWPPMHIMVLEGLRAYGYHREAAVPAASFLAGMLKTYQKTGQLWEKYNVLTGGPEVPLERYPTPPMRGWSSAAALLLGRYAFPDYSPAQEAPA